MRCIPGHEKEHLTPAPPAAPLEPQSRRAETVEKGSVLMLCSFSCSTFQRFNLFNLLYQPPRRKGRKEEGASLCRVDGKGKAPLAFGDDIPM